jgi:hypothetical protein
MQVRPRSHFGLCPGLRPRRRSRRPHLQFLWKRPIFGLVAIAPLLTACGLSSPSIEGALDNALTASSQAPPPHRKLVARALKGFKEQEDLIDLEISEPRWAERLGGPAWLVCVKFNPNANSYFYTFYIRNDAVIETRFAVGTDRCGRQTFTPFDPQTAK